MGGDGDPVSAFIERWRGREGGAERANYALFLVGLCNTLGVPEPDPASASTELNDYVFERAVKFRDAGTGRIDLYKRGCFILEAKQSRWKGGKKEIAGQEDMFEPEAEGAALGRGGAERAWDVLMLNARRQAEDYARSLPPSHDWPPFILVCDVGHVIEVYSDFTGKGRNYTQFPDRQGFRIYLDDLRREEIRDRLQRIWTDPHSLDPTKRAARTTREIARRLADVSKLLEGRGHQPERVAHFLMRCLFTMFAEDVKLLPKDSFKDLLDRCRERPENFPRMVGQLWEAMNAGGFAYGLEAQVKRFNGEFFRDTEALHLNKEEIGELHAAASANWHEVEPAIFGTLLEQALDPAERKRLGAHYTPRAYVERLVLATIVEPLRDDWRDVQATAEKLKREGRAKEAAETVRQFHQTLCRTRVLDPACGTGNFLYVAMELMKRLEGEVLEALLNLGGQEALALEKETIDPHQFLGLELNQRAVAIAELVLWIGYLQWHFRTRGEAPGEPILKAFRNIRYLDAVLTWDGWPVPKIVDGKETYPNPRRPEWPEAEFIVGNPPFIGAKYMRERLPAGYPEALWRAHSHINQSADYVMYWWDRTAEFLTRKGTILRRFGLVTTNSITQSFQRRVVERHMRARSPISLVMAIPDHPWTRATRDAAAVRIGMTVAEAGSKEGLLRKVVREEALDTDEPVIEFLDQIGVLNSDLTIGVEVTQALPLRASSGICSPGVKLHGDGFIVGRLEAEHLGLGTRPGLERHIRKYRNGRDLTGLSRDALVIDMFGLTAGEVRQRFPEVYQRLWQTVRRQRQETFDSSGTRDSREYLERWWIFGKPRQEIRPALEGINRYIATPVTQKHRFFVFLDGTILPDDALMVVASSDSMLLGVLSSRVFLTWFSSNQSSLEDRPRFIKSRCFDPFPFPDPVADELKDKIRAAAEELDATRKRVLAEHPDLTLTKLYNVLERIRAVEAATRAPTLSRGERVSPKATGEGVRPIGQAPEPSNAEPPHPAASQPPSPHGRGLTAPLTDAEEDIRDRGLVLILKELHETIDRLVAEAYGWLADLSDEDILGRLVALNRERAAEERRGIVRWLRPEYQIPRFGTPKEKAEQIEAELPQAAAAAKKPSFPTSEVGRTAAVFAMLAEAREPIDASALAARFRQGRRVERQVAATLMALARMGHLDSPDAGRSFALRRSG